MKVYFGGADKPRLVVDETVAEGNRDERK